MVKLAGVRELCGSYIVSSDMKEITWHFYNDFNSGLPQAAVLLAIHVNAWYWKGIQ
jgi:hypothetical protein